MTEQISCSGSQNIGRQCPNPVTWINKYGVNVCSFHKNQIYAFTWESRDKAEWQELTLEVKPKS